MGSVPGTLPFVVGRYALYDEIAAGGMATVHLGRLLGPVGFARTVAVKRLHAHLARDPNFATMFLDEARLAARIQHPNVVPTLDVVSAQGELFLVMEYVQGESLSRLIRKATERGRPLGPRIAASVVAQALHGLHAAHEARNEAGEPLGLVHRDVSPQNILVGSDGVARVADFGVAKATGRLQATRAGETKGKFAYMAPEQATGGTVDRRADIYAAAVVFWEALTGQRLFEGENEMALLRKVMEGCTLTPSQAVPGLDPRYDDIVMRGLTDPLHRFATAREMALAIEGRGALAMPSEVGAWVEEQIAAQLAQRAMRIAEIERSGSHPSLAAAQQYAPQPPSSRGPVSPTQWAGGLSPYALQAQSPPLAVTQAYVPPQPSPVLPPARPPSDSRSASSVRSFVEVTHPPGAPPARMAPGVVVLVGAIAVIVGLVFELAVTRAVISRVPLPSTRATPVAAAPPTGTTASGGAPSVDESAPAKPPTTTDAPPSASASGAAASAVASATAAPTASGKPKNHVPGTTTTATATATAKPKGANCDPPYTLDANGVKIFKRECF